MSRFTLALVLSFLILSSVIATAQTRYRDPVFAGVDATLGVVYGSALNPATGVVDVLRLDVREPTGDAEMLRPAIVIVHGGGFVGGGRATGQMVALATDYTNLGYVTASISYRLTTPAYKAVDPEGVIEDAKEDFKAAVRFLRANAVSYGIDPERIAAIGSSAGAITVLSGAYVDGEGMTGTPGVSSEITCVVGLWGGLEDPTVIDTGDVPNQLIHGTNDSTVPFSASVAVNQRSTMVGVSSELIPILGAGHAPWGTFFNDHFFDTVAFFFGNLKLGQLVGLRAEPGYSAGGLLTITAVGVAGDQRLSLAAFAPAAFPIADVGILCVDLLGAVPLELSPFDGSSSRLPEVSGTAFVPAVFLGTTVYTQEYHATATGAPRLLTNCVELQF